MYAKSTCVFLCFVAPIVALSRTHLSKLSYIYCIVNQRSTIHLSNKYSISIKLEMLVAGVVGEGLFRLCIHIKPCLTFLLGSYIF